MSLWSYASISPPHLVISALSPLFPSVPPPTLSSACAKLTHPFLTHRAYTSLRPRTRLLLGLGLMANAGLMMAFEGNIGEALGFGSKAAEEDVRKVWEKMPKVHIVEREKEK